MIDEKLSDLIAKLVKLTGTEKIHWTKESCIKEKSSYGYVLVTANGKIDVRKWPEDDSSCIYAVMTIYDKNDELVEQLSYDDTEEEFKSVSDLYETIVKHHFSWDETINDIMSDLDEADKVESPLE